MNLLEISFQTFTGFRLQRAHVLLVVGGAARLREQGPHFR